MDPSSMSCPHNQPVRDALKVMKSTVDKVKTAVEYFHRSTVGSEK
jgi:hypothetical protein